MKGRPPSCRSAALILTSVCLVGCRQEPPAPATIDSPAQTAASSDSMHDADVLVAEVRQGPSRQADTVVRRSRASFRPPDQRPRHDAERLAEMGIREYRSRRLLLYTDIEPEVAATLPPLLDQVFQSWESYFGPLPPARDGSDFQLTGYLMRDQDRFRQAGLLPVTLPAFAHGKHDAQQFWMNDSDYDYYRRHLLIHEATHCFMQAMGGTTRDVPVWYLEGMAELFAAHQPSDDGSTFFRIMPTRKEDFVGFGRVQMIQRAVADGRLLTLNEIARLKPDDFIHKNESYAWAWALCTFLDQHPRYHDRLQSLGRTYVGEGFETSLRRLFDPVVADLAAEWEVFAQHLCYGFDVERAAIQFDPGTAIAPGEKPHETSVSARAGWQSSLVEVLEGETYELRADGRTVLAETTRPWESEAQGISIRYSEGMRIGRLQGRVISAPDPETQRRRISDVIDLGREAKVVAPFDGTLYLRVNDFWNELSDNSGEYTVNIAVHASDN